MALQNPSIVGRSKELSSLSEFLDASIRGAGKTIFISGEAGSGKTRLVNEFLNSACDKVDVLYGWCLSNVSTPYFPFIEAFSSVHLRTRRAPFATAKTYRSST